MTDLRKFDAFHALGAEIKRLRRLRDLRQGELARIMGVSQTMVSRDERGTARGIPPERLNLYIQHIGLDRGYVRSLLDGVLDQEVQDETLAAQLDAVAAIPDIDEAVRREFARILRRRRAVAGPLVTTDEPDIGSEVSRT